MREKNNWKITYVGSRKRENIFAAIEFVDEQQHQKKKKKNVQQQQDHRPVDRFYGKQTLYDDRSINHRRYQKRRIFKPIIKAYT